MGLQRQALLELQVLRLTPILANVGQTLLRVDSTACRLGLLLIHFNFNN